MVVGIVAIVVQVVAPRVNNGDGATLGGSASQASTSSLRTARPTATRNPIPAGNDWTQYRFDVAGTGVNPEGLIRSSNINQLQHAWTMSDVFGYHPFESTPAVVDGKIYVTSGHSLHALDLLTGNELWHFDDSGKENGTIFSSVAVDKSAGLAVYGTPGGRLYAINIRTHMAAWMVQLGNPDQGANVWSSPLIVNGKVYIGLASTNDNPCVRGDVTAVDLLTGHVVWTHYFAPDNELGSAVWSSVTADVAAGQIIVTSGNPCGFPAGTNPQGGTVDNEQDAILALDWNTGATVWKYSAMQYDGCDCDFGEGAAVFTYQQTKYIVAGNKAGVVYALTPPTSPGEQPTVAWSQTITAADQLGAGGVFQPPTYSNGLIFVGAGPTLDGACPNGALWAFRADSGDTAWRVCTPNQLVGASAVSGDLLLMGMQNEVVALSTATGAQVWQADQPQGTAWGGVAVSHGFLLSPMVGGPNGNSGQLFCYRLLTS